MKFKAYLFKTLKTSQKIKSFSMFQLCQLFNIHDISLLASSMYRLHNNASDHSGVTNMYSLSNAGNSRSGTPQHHRQQHQPAQVQHEQSQPYLFDDGDLVRLVQSHNGGISHSFTLPHNLNSGGMAVPSSGGTKPSMMHHQYMTLNRE